MAEAQRSRTIIIISLITIAASLVVMVGWIFNIPVLKSILPGFNNMKFNSAFCFVLIGGALLLTQYKTGKYNNLSFIALSLLCALFGLVSLTQNLFHFNTGLDQLFISDNTTLLPNYHFPGRMAINSAVNTLLMGVGLLMLTGKKRSFYR